MRIPDVSLEPQFARLLGQAKAGDEQAWSVIYRELAPIVHGYLRLRGAPEPEDLVGETFLQVARKLADFEGEYAQFRSWVFVVAHHRLIDDRRRRGRRPATADEAALTSAPDHSPTPEQVAIVNDQWPGITDMLRVLSPDQQTVVLLRVMGDLSVEETAEAMGKKAGTVRVIQHRALAALRDRLRAKSVTDEGP